MFFGAVVLDILEDWNYDLDSPIPYVTFLWIELSNEFDFIDDSQLVDDYFDNTSLHAQNDLEFTKFGIHNRWHYERFPMRR